MRLTSLTIHVTLLCLCCGCAATISREPASPRFEVTQLPEVPLGVGGAFSGLIGDTLVLAGGSYFKDPPPIPKTWISDVLILRPEAIQWTSAGSLAGPRAYGAAVSTPQGLLLAGGADAGRHFDTCEMLTLDGGHVLRRPLPPLPQTAAYLAGARLGHHVYVAGGRADPRIQEALHTFWRLDLDHLQLGWQKLEPWPGPARVLSAVVAQDGAIFVISGAELLPSQTDQPVRRFLRDAYRYQPGRGWSRIADLPSPVVAAPAAAWGQHQILVFGGDDGHLFDKGTALGDAHPGFQHALLSCDTRSGTWTPLQDLEGLPVTTFATRQGDLAILIPTGEDRPGHRSKATLAIRPRR